MSDAIKALKKNLAKKRSDQFEDGAVIRWTMVKSGKEYTFTALKTERGWYTSSTASDFMPMVMNFDRLMAVLEMSNTIRVEVASEWTSVLS